MRRGTVREACGATLEDGPQRALEGSEMIRFPLEVWRGRQDCPMTLGAPVKLPCNQLAGGTGRRSSFQEALQPHSPNPASFPQGCRCQRSAFPDGAPDRWQFQALIWLSAYRVVARLTLWEGKVPEKK